MRKLHLIALGALWLGGLASCKQGDVGPSDDAILQSNIADITTYATTNKLNGSITQSGVYYAVAKPSTSSVTPGEGQEIEFSYVLSQLTRVGSSTIVTTTFLDSTNASKSVYSPIIASNVGLTEAILKMHEGEQGIVLLPYVYLPDIFATSNLQPNAPLRFDIKLKRTRTEDQQIDDYITANNLTVTQKTADGLRFILTKANPTGATPKAGQTITVNYAGKLLRATTGFSGGTGTSTKVVGTPSFITGFEEALALLKVGEKATIFFPSSLGYGAAGSSGVIPPYAPLQFDIELVSAQ